MHFIFTFCLRNYRFSLLITDVMIVSISIFELLFFAFVENKVIYSIFPSPPLTCLILKGQYSL